MRVAVTMGRYPTRGAAVMARCRRGNCARAQPHRVVGRAKLMDPPDCESGASVVASPRFKRTVVSAYLPDVASCLSRLGHRPSRRGGCCYARAQLTAGCAQPPDRPRRCGDEGAQFLDPRAQSLNRLFQRVNGHEQRLNGRRHRLDEREQRLSDRRQCLNDHGHSLNDRRQRLNEQGQPLSEHGHRPDGRLRSLNDHAHASDRRKPSFGGHLPKRNPRGPAVVKSNQPETTKNP